MMGKKDTARTLRKNIWYKQRNNLLSPIHSLEKKVNKKIVAEQVPNYSRKLCSLELNYVTACPQLLMRPQPQMGCLALGNNSTKLQRTAAHCNTMQHSARHDMAHTAAHCNTLQHSARHSNCNTLQHKADARYSLSYDSSLGYVAVCCSVLQNVAVC